MKVWITKYALTSGITEEEARTCSESEGMIAVGYNYYHGNGRQWCLTKEDAIKRAEFMRLKEIERLEKKIIKLRSMNFR